MQYPLISEYREAILNAEDNFDKLSHLRPVLDAKGDPVMSSGNFAVVFKMTDGTKCYAVKCFTKDQAGREKAYRQICPYLSCVPSPYLVHTEYLEKELFVDTNQSDNEEFPVLVMDWVEGVSLDRYVKTIRNDGEKRIRLANEFRELSFWLMGQEFAHGDLKPDNIIVTEQGRLVLVDYDGMFVPAMRGQKARELGTPLYRYKGRTEQDFDEFADDYACVFILLVLMADSIEPIDFDAFASPDVSDILHLFSAYLEQARMAPYIAAFLLVASGGRLNRQVLYPLLAHRSGDVQPVQIPLPPPPGIPQPQNPKPAPQLTFTVNGVSFEMISVEGGTFTMGATAEQGSDVFDNEKPAHEVTLSSYAIGKYEVTQALWKAVMGYNPSNFKGDSLPVEQVSRNGCQGFIKKLNSLTGKNFRLPTEAEWEFAARGGKKSKGYKYSGSDNLDEVAWYTNNSNGQTHPVGTKKPNELGIYDMSGNVWEWCGDWYGNYSSSVATNPTGPVVGICRVLRGGSWDDYAGFCSVSSRIAPVSRYGSLGLRLVLPLSL
jgi:formylglycine-generating enzyme required for sulfatase activity